MIILITFIIAGHQLLIRYREYRELKEMEERFPTFLRDLIESIRSGMAPHQAIIATSKLEYGALSKEIKKMANQISWGMTMESVLDQFARRMRRSRRLHTSINMIRESYFSGGEMETTLDAVADNVTVLEESEKERKSLLNQYVVIMYGVTLIFIGIVVAINRLLVPVFQVSGPAIGEAVGLINPCTVCVGVECSVCVLYDATSHYLFGIDPRSIGAYYTSLFFFMSLVQALFSGLIAGQISEGSLTAGTKHSLILAAITFGAFGILVRFGLMGV
jgi:flagellar protein FlaJ